MKQQVATLGAHVMENSIVSDAPFPRPGLQANILIIWDRLFGTYQAEGDVRILRPGYRYGLR
jgi:hypothetical protein